MSNLQVTITKSIGQKTVEKQVDVSEFSAWLSKGWSIKRGEASKIINFARDNQIKVTQLIGASPKLSREEAIAAYQKGQISEGQLADSLRTDRLSARIIFQNHHQGNRHHE